MSDEARTRAYFTKDWIPFFVTPLVFATMPCRIPVVPGGDGADQEAADAAPLDVRTDKCRHPAYCLIGAGAVCRHHFDVFMRIAGATPLWTPPPCEPPA